MTAWVDQLKEGLPEYAKDTKLNLDAVIKRSALAPEETLRVLDALQTGELCACNRTVGGETL